MQLPACATFRGAAHVGEDPRYHLFRYFAIARYLSVGAQVLLSALRI